ncbi:MAG: PRD domain-containing protein [Thermovenabulum sp.]|uniref:PRD domain-containing protein n=1 Tax=Thermovenabulum sp. TaxID=3100335 RepID=UPI003C7E1D33
MAFKIIKVLNNNTVLAKDETKDKEAVLMGKGLGFSKVQGQRVEEDKIEKVFYFYDKKEFRQYEELTERIDRKVVEVTGEIISLISEEIKEPLSEHIHLALTDHINFTLERLSLNLDIKNPFLDEIRILYPKEYALAIKAKNIIEERLGVCIPEDEAGFIAMHIHAAMVNAKISKTVKYTHMIEEMTKIIENLLNVKINKDDINYGRLVVHLRFVLERAEKGNFIKNPLLKAVKKNFKGSFNIAKKLGDYIEEKMKVKLPEDELSYLAMHIQRIKETSF